MVSKHKNWSATGNYCRSNASLSYQRFKKMLEKQKIVKKNCWKKGKKNIVVEMFGPPIESFVRSDKEKEMKTQTR